MHDEQIRDLLRSLESDDEPNPVFADALHRRLLVVARQGPRRQMPLVLLAAALLTALAAGLALGAGVVRLPLTVEASATPSATVLATQSDAPSPSTDASPESLAPEPSAATPSAAPSAEATAFARPSDVLPLGSEVRVTGDSLRIRQSPGVESPVSGVVNAGDVLYLTAAGDPRLAPIPVDGFDWYPVTFIPGYSGWPVEPAESDGRVGGWIAARSASESFVELVDPQCPGSVTDLSSVVALTPYERVACFGDGSLTVEGTYGCPFCDSLTHPYTTEPTWLAEWTLHLNVLVPTWGEYPPFPGSIVLATPPDVAPIGIEHRGAVLRVTGHFDDARAADCSITPEPAAGADPPHDEAVEWYCRERFVVDSWEAIGTDPAYNALVPG